MAIHMVRLSRVVQKQLRKMPSFILDMLETWVDAVERDGLEEVRKLKGYHDEPLKGRRRGQRSIRLSRSYRAIYTVRPDGAIKFVLIEEVTKHEY